MRLCILLRLAILLHRIRNHHCMPDLQLRVSGCQLRLLFPDQWLDDNPLAAADLAKEAQWLQRVNHQLEVA